MHSHSLEYSLFSSREAGFVVGEHRSVCVKACLYLFVIPVYHVWYYGRASLRLRQVWAHHPRGGHVEGLLFCTFEYSVYIFYIQFEKHTYFYIQFEEYIFFTSNLKRVRQKRDTAEVTRVQKKWEQGLCDVHQYVC